MYTKRSTRGLVDSLCESSVSVAPCTGNATFGGTRTPRRPSSFERSYLSLFKLKTRFLPFVFIALAGWGKLGDRSGAEGGRAADWSKVTKK
jgi:hypothetical protein